MANCQAITKKGKGPPCTNGDASPDADSGLWLCHLHHPKRLFRQQISATREDRQTAAIARKAALYPNRVDLAIEGRAQRERGELDDGTTPMLDRKFALPMDAGKASPPLVSKTLFRGKP